MLIPNNLPFSSPTCCDGLHDVRQKDGMSFFPVVKGKTGCAVDIRCVGKEQMIRYASILLDIGESLNKFPLLVGRGNDVLLLLPLDGAGGFRGEVVEDAVDAGDLGDDALGDVVEERVGDLLDGGSHCIAGVDGTDDDGPVPRALVVADTSGLVVGHNGEVLPYFALEAVLGKLLAEDGV